MNRQTTSLSILVCRGCCCGTQDGPDHEAQLARLQAAAANVGGRLKVTNCIGPCDRKNVVVVRTRPSAGRWTARYFAAVDDAEVNALCSWIEENAVDAPVPAELGAVQFRWPLPRNHPGE